tara:strand:+ start:137 stop:382 length:246 start_codon:yes stop_codon:yes gene_type:complete
MIKLYIIGLSILFIAILANTLANYINLNTWYNFAQEAIQKESILTALQNQKIEDIIWLFIAYPIILGCGYLIGEKINSILF